MAATLSGVRGCRPACPTTSQCVGGVPWVVPCGGGEGGGAVAVVPGNHGPVVIHRHQGGRRASHSADTLRNTSQSGAELRALRSRGVFRRGWG